MENSRIIAKSEGKPRYLSSKPCVRGHLGLRYTSNGVCVECDTKVLAERRRGKLPKVKKVPSGVCAYCGSHYEKSNNANRYCSMQCRFWSKVQTGQPDECWQWLGAKQPFGHGQFALDGGRGARREHAHRVAYAIHNGLIDDSIGAGTFHGTCVCHKCDNPSCVNPSHLFLGTQADNISDMNSKSRHGRGAAPKKYNKSHIEKVVELKKTGLSQQKIAWILGIPQAIVSSMLRGDYL